MRLHAHTMAIYAVNVLTLPHKQIYGFTRSARLVVVSLPLFSPKFAFARHYNCYQRDGLHASIWDLMCESYPVGYAARCSGRLRINGDHQEPFTRARIDTCRANQTKGLTAAEN